MKEFSIHKRFLKDGKAGIRLLTQKIHLLISNCPPGQLSSFLKSLSIKIAARGKKQGARTRMFGDLSLQFEEISPLTEKDVEMARKNCGEQKPRGNLPPITPKTTREPCSYGTKRKLDDSALAEQPRKFASVATAGAQAPPPKRHVHPLKSGGSLTSEQQYVLNLVMKGVSVFFTGSAGTGKSFLLKHIIGVLPPETTVASASTGAAACLIGGTTLHQFAGMGTGAGTLEQCIALASRPHKAEQWRKCQCLIIDEVSMISGDLFDKLECVARSVRKSREPFGGIQLVLCGDFLQLPPVTAKGERRYCFQSKSWRRSVTRTVELTEVHRQRDKRFIDILQHIRYGRCPSAVAAALQATSTNEIECHGIVATKLFTHTEDVNHINQKELRNLPGSSRRFTAEDSTTNSSVEEYLNSMCPVAKVLELKVGAQVMLAKNMHIQEGLVNGARGVLTKFDAAHNSFPVVRLTNGKEFVIRPQKWSVRAANGALVTRVQLPLKLAWAISIHKSQGMTLDCVEVSLSRVFEDGQAYVALSRARSLDGLRVLDFTSSCARADKHVIEYYQALRQSRKNYIDDKENNL
jgi:ATP-dependent DNA helicase PIF1